MTLASTAILTAANVQLTAKTGSFSLEGTGTITDSSLFLSSSSGNIGTGKGLKTLVDELAVETNGTGSVAISNGSALDATAGGNWSVIANGGLTVGNVASANGGVTLVSKFGPLDVVSNASIVAGNGNIVIQNLDNTNGSIKHPIRSNNHCLQYQ